MVIHTNCLHFRGDLPCKPHKQNGYHCHDCPVFTPVEKTILIIKLGAIGDVIRTTPILHKLKKEFPNAHISWLTYSPEIVPANFVNRIYGVTAENLTYLKSRTFDWVINLDKDQIAISLCKTINSPQKTGFTMDALGNASPIGTEAETAKWFTGLFDDVNKANTKHYVEEMFNILGYPFEGEEYILDFLAKPEQFPIDKNKKVIGLNTGCGGRWSSRLWPETYWITLSTMLLENGFEVVLLGGEQEHEKNLRIQKESGAKYFGYFDLRNFISLMNETDTVVTAVTMGMHLAIGLKKNLILFNNIFNKNEFHLYGRGEILEPDFDCPCYFSPTCPNDCMQYLYPEKVLGSIKKLHSVKQ